MWKRLGVGLNGWSLTKGMGKPTYGLLLSSGIGGASGRACCSTVGVPVPKILSLVIWACAVASFSR